MPETFTKEPVDPKRVFYVAGPGDAIKAHEHWKAGKHDPSEVSVTFSGQIEDYAKDVGAALYIVCYHSRRDRLDDGETRIEHLPKPWPGAPGIFYHLRELWYGLMLLWRAVRWRADLAIIDSGATHYFWQSLFRLFGIRVVPVLHNSLWPHGFRPTGLVQRIIFALDKPFWRRVPVASLCVSPECARQVVELAGENVRPLVQVRAQFRPGFFKDIPPAPPHDARPFRIFFIGRVNRSKGVFDIVEMAEQIEAAAPGRVRWTLCGTGEDFDELKALVEEKHMGEIVDLKGWTSLEDLLDVYRISHAAIVPTRSTFIEGLAMTAAEAALAGRPVITNPVVPALEVLRPACVAAKTNEPDTYVEQILKLIDDPAWYEEMRLATKDVVKPFVDRRNGLAAVLKRVLNENRI